MTHRPAMTFDAATLLDPRLMEDGPLVVHWGQDHEEFTHRELTFGDRPHVSAWKRLRGARAFRFAIRVQPPAGVPLMDFGARLSERVGQPWPPASPPHPDDRAIWMPGAVLASNASLALGSICRIFESLAGIDVTAIQVRVEHWDATPTENVVAA